MSTLETDQAKQVLVELIRAAGGEWTGLTKLYKAFYLAHLYYAESAPGYLTNWPIVKMPNGPGIESGEALLNELVIAGILAREGARIGPYPTTRYRIANPRPGRRSRRISSMRSAPPSNSCRKRPQTSLARSRTNTHDHGLPRAMAKR